MVVRKPIKSEITPFTTCTIKVSRWYLIQSPLPLDFFAGYGNNCLLTSFSDNLHVFRRLTSVQCKYTNELNGVLIKPHCIAIVKLELLLFLIIGKKNTLNGHRQLGYQFGK